MNGAKAKHFNLLVRKFCVLQSSFLRKCHQNYNTPNRLLKSRNCYELPLPNNIRDKIIPSIFNSSRILLRNFEKTHNNLSRNCCTSQSNSSIKNGYHEECEHAINEQIVAELNAAYAYLSMACYFGRSDVALPGCHGFFIKMHEEEMGHAHKIIRYQNMRGGRVKLCPLTCTSCSEWDIRKALEVSLEMEKLIKEKLIGVNNVGEMHKDLNLMDFIVTDFIAEQERSICEMSRLLARYNNMSGCGKCGCSDYLFDKHIHSAFVKKIDSEDIYKLEQKYK